MEKTLILVKPDAMQRNLAGAILSRFESAGLRIVAAKMLRFTRELGLKHYAEHIQKPFFPELLDYMMSYPIIAVVFEGDNAVENARKIIGATNPKNAEEGTIRKDFAIDGSQNSVHGSDSLASADREIPIFFSENELFSTPKNE